MSTIYVGPSSSGNASGSSASNALSINSLDKAVQLAGPGGTVVLLSDHGAYTVTSSINLSHGGTDGASVTIIGEDSAGHASNVVINGNRPATYTAGMSSGSPVFRMIGGANDLNFQHITFNNVGAAFLAAADVHNISIRDMTANNVQYFFSDYASVKGTTATVSNLTMANVDVHGFSKGVIRLQYDSHDVAITNVFGDSMHEDGDGIAMGVHLDGTAHNITITGSTMENAVASSSTYWNGDGFTTENGVYNVTFKDDVSRGNADGGFDLKSTATTLTNCTADDNGRNFRLWSNVTLTDCTGLDPHKQGGTTGGQEQIQILRGSTVTVNGGSFSDSGSGSKVVLFDAGGSITFTGSEIVYASTAVLHGGTGTFTINPADVMAVAATGLFSTNGASLLPQATTPPPAQTPPAAVAPTDLTLSASSVAENSANGTSIGFAAANSAATGVTYSLTGNAGGAFAINGQTGEITVANGSLLNYESSSSLPVTVQATDSAGSYQESFTIAVTNVNEAPTGATFSGGTIADNSAAGTVVGTVHGTDPDAGDTLTYSLSDNAGGRFVIDPNTGAVTVASGAVFDYATQSQWRIKAVVTDAHGLTYTAPFTVSLTHVATTSGGGTGGGSGGGKGHKTISYLGSVGTSVVANPGLHTAPASDSIPTGTAKGPAASSGATLHLFDAAATGSGLGHADAFANDFHAAAVDHMAAFEQFAVPHLTIFDHADHQTLPGPALHASDFLF